MRIILSAFFLMASMAAFAHEDINGYWGDAADAQIWRNSAGECWQSGTFLPDQAIAACDSSIKPAAKPTAAKPVVKQASATSAAAAKAAADKAAALAAALRDTDKDGVSDAVDQCPNSKPGAKVDEKGCYIALKEVVTIAINVQFPTGSAQVDAAGDAEIRKLADFMTEYPQTTVEVGGHTDNMGNAAMNTRLSQARADAVRQRLTTKFSIAGDRVTAKGYGPGKPLADNNTADGRAKNRRVEGVVKQTVEKVQN